MSWQSELDELLRRERMAHALGGQEKVGEPEIQTVNRGRRRSIQRARRKSLVGRHGHGLDRRQCGPTRSERRAYITRAAGRTAR